jgi:hypothetical protein
MRLHAGPTQESHAIRLEVLDEHAQIRETRAGQIPLTRLTYAGARLGDPSIHHDDALQDCRKNNDAPK